MTRSVPSFPLPSARRVGVAFAVAVALAVVALSIVAPAPSAHAVARTSSPAFTGPSIPLPDLATATVPLTVGPMPGVVSDVNLRIGGTVCDETWNSTAVGIATTFVGDLRIFVVAPDGTSVQVKPDMGNGSRNMCQVTFDDSATTAQNTGTLYHNVSLSPLNPLAAFNGLSAEGTWNVIVQDVYGADAGAVHALSLDITTTRDDAPLVELELTGVDGVAVPVASGAQVAVPASSALPAQWTLTSTAPDAQSGYYLYTFGPDCAIGGATLAAGEAEVCSEVSAVGAATGPLALGALGGLAVGADDDSTSFPLTLNVVDASTLSLDETTVAPGETVTLRGAGFDVGDALELGSASNLGGLGAVAVAAGAISHAITVPADAALGTHSVTLTSAGVAFAVQSFTVAPDVAVPPVSVPPVPAPVPTAPVPPVAGPAGAPTLPVMGAESSAPLATSMLLLLLGGVLVGSRRWSARGIR